MPTGTHSQSIPYIFSYYAENFNPEHPTFPHWLIFALCNRVIIIISLFLISP